MNPTAEAFRARVEEAIERDDPSEGDSLPPGGKPSLDRNRGRLLDSFAVFGSILLSGPKKRCVR